jgi:Rv2525c-like, glycoside hydrolase-like domain
MPHCPSAPTATSNSATRLAVLLATLIVVVLLPAAALAAPAATGRLATFHGYRVLVPPGWPVYDLAAHPATCVRFNRHAVYLGAPGARQDCGVSAAGRTESILVQPLTARVSQVLPATAAAGAAGSGAEAQIVDRAHRVVVTATWNRHPAVVRRALGVASLSAAVSRAIRLRPHSAVAAARARMRSYARSRATAPAPATPAGPGQIYTGLGFDACNTPSTTTMADWGSSPYRAIGIYIGGANMACSQPNLSATWVSQESAAGWHMVPIYVGLQSPSNSCGCAGISPANATTQGAAAAQDAVVDAQAIGMGPGNPLYFDMEAYSRTSTNSAAVLAFLQAWTNQLHAEGYVSGVYSSDASGIADLVGQQGTGYVEPDELWIANWNGQQTTTDSYVPAQYWPAHQRLHQYQGAHNETYGGAKINIDGDYLDSATAAAGTGSGVDTAPTPAPAPSLRVTAGPDGTTNLTPSWPGATGVVSWQLIGGSSATSLTWTGPNIAAGARLPLVTRNSFPYWEVEAIGADGSVLGTSAATPTPAHVMVFGQSAFAPRSGLGAVPVGCLGISPCAVTTTISSGRTTYATTNREFIGAGGGLAYFKLSSTAQKALQHAHGHQLPVNVTVRSTTGAKVTRKLTLSSFTTRNPGPARSGAQASQLKLIGTTEFVSHGWVGGILAACVGSAPCQASVTLMAGRSRLAKSTLQTIGAGELGYVSFTLTSAGHRLLTKSKTNQLGTTATVSTPVPAGTTTPAPTGPANGGGGIGASAPSTTPTATTATATAHLALVRFP